MQRDKGLVGATATFLTACSCHIHEESTTRLGHEPGMRVSKQDRGTLPPAHVRDIVIKVPKGAVVHTLIKKDEPDADVIVFVPYRGYVEMFEVSRKLLQIEPQDIATPESKILYHRWGRVINKIQVRS